MILNAYTLTNLLWLKSVNYGTKQSVTTVIGGVATFIIVVLFLKCKKKIRMEQKGKSLKEQCKKKDIARAYRLFLGITVIIMLFAFLFEALAIEI